MVTTVKLKWLTVNPYSENQVLALVPKRPGVYRLGYIDSRDNKWRVFYVGQADNLEARLLDHLSISQPNACIKRHLRDYRCYAKVAVVENPLYRDGAERALYDHFQPPCNDRRPGGPDVQINFD